MLAMVGADWLAIRRSFHCPVHDHAAVTATVSARAPLRIALGGGGTDLRSHFSEHGGFVVSAAIDRHVRIRISPVASTSYHLEHLEHEQVENPAMIRHPILRAAIVRHGNGQPFTLVSEGDVEPGTGLGSSGSYTVCAVKAIELAVGRDMAARELAEAACTIEIEDMERTVGKQDQYAAAFGGLNSLTFDRDGSVEVRPLEVPATVRDALRSHFVLVYTGQTRSASKILSGQVERSLAGDADLTRNLLRTADVARATCTALEAGDLTSIGELMNESWALKRERLAHVAMPKIEELREIALAAGARGAMLMGAGGGGYLLAYSPNPQRVLAALARVGARELEFGLDFDGCVARTN